MIHINRVQLALSNFALAMFSLVAFVSMGVADDVVPKKSSPPSPLAAEIERFRALEPAERLQFVEKRAEAKVPFVAASRGDLVTVVIERGSIEPANYVELICKVKAKRKESAATTIKWLIDDGAHVKKGDRLVLLDDSAVREQLDEANVRAKAAEAVMKRATEMVASTKRENAVDVRLAEIDVKLAEIKLKDSPAGQSKEELELKVEQAKLLLERAESRAKTKLAQAESESQARKVAWELDVNRQRDLEAEVKQCILTAPADGFAVYYVPEAGRFGPAMATIAAGEPVREGQKLLRIVDLKQLAIATRIHEGVISTVRSGQLAQVRVDAYPGQPVRGKVTQVATVASPANWRSADVKVYPVTIAIENAPPGLKPGMTAEVRVDTGERKGVLQVPIKSVLSVGNERLCFVKVGKELLERKVRIGASNAESVEIRNGLKEGDVILADPAALFARR